RTGCGNSVDDRRGPRVAVARGGCRRGRPPRPTRRQGLWAAAHGALHHTGHHVETEKVDRGTGRDRPRLPARVDHPRRGGVEMTDHDERSDLVTLVAELEKRLSAVEERTVGKSAPLSPSNDQYCSCGGSLYWCRRDGCPYG